MKETEIVKVVQSVCNDSLNFPLADVAYACRDLLANKARKYKQERIKELKLNFQGAKKNNEVISYQPLEKEIDALEKSNTLYVFYEYIHINEASARAVFYGDHINIEISDKLREKAIKNGRYTSDVKTLCDKISHEIAHMILHTDDFLKLRGTQGTLQLSSEEKEEDVRVFVKNVLPRKKEDYKALSQYL
jgi:cell shape-determining protein MreC